MIENPRLKRTKDTLTRPRVPESLRSAIGEAAGTLRTTDNAVIIRGTALFREWIKVPIGGSVEIKTFKISRGGGDARSSDEASQLLLKKIEENRQKNLKPLRIPRPLEMLRTQQALKASNQPTTLENATPMEIALAAVELYTELVAHAAKGGRITVKRWKKRNPANPPTTAIDETPDEFVELNAEINYKNGEDQRARVYAAVRERLATRKPLL